MITIDKPSRIFIACPLTGLIDKDGKMEPKAKEAFQKIIKIFRDQGHLVFSAHELEEWGDMQEELEAGKIVKRDIHSLTAADYVVFLDLFPHIRSIGTATELGSLIAMNYPKSPNPKKHKGIIIIRHKEEENEELKAGHEMLKKILGGRGEIIEVEGLNEAVNEIEKRVPKVNKLERNKGKIRLFARSIFDKPNSAKFFTHKPRKRPL